jgi:beta-glucosidase
MGGEGMMAAFRSQIFHPSAPLAAIRAEAPGAKVIFNDGRYVASAVAAAKAADVVIVFGNQWMGEGEDAPDLSLPEGQDALIAAVTAANPNSIVVLQTGGAVTMPWLDQAGAVVEAWYSGVKGGEAIADVLFGEVDASGRLPMTFPASIDQYPRAPNCRALACRKRPASTWSMTRAPTSAIAASPPPARSRCSRSATACPTPVRLHQPEGDRRRRR